MPVAYNIRLYIVIYSVQNKKLVVIKGGLSGYSLTGYYCISMMSNVIKLFNMKFVR